jgi:hypothetical protein
MDSSPLAGWENFYVIMGSSAGGLTGLTFVVIALATEARRTNAVGLNTFITPTIVHFGTVLGLAAFMCVPRLTALGLALLLGAAGIAGLVYVGVIAANIHHKLGDYVAVREDWFWNVVLPGVAYGVLCATALLIEQGRAEIAVYGVALASVGLLYIGIHNAWDIAIWMSLKKQDDSKEEKPGAAGG